MLGRWTHDNSVLATLQAGLLSSRLCIISLTQAKWRHQSASLSALAYFMMVKTGLIRQLTQSLAVLECCCCLPTPMTLASGGVRCSRLWSTSQLLRPSGQQCCPRVSCCIIQCPAKISHTSQVLCLEQWSNNLFHQHTKCSHIVWIFLAS